jgi:beta-glucosidase
MTDAHAETLAGLTLEQKASLTSGADFWLTKPIPEAGIPALRVSDGPHGLRKQGERSEALGLGNAVPATCFPPAVALASSWNPALARAVGEAIAVEAHSEGVAVVLGPGINIKRSPLCGRNFEYMSEDPFLAGVMGAAWVAGLQSQGVGCSLKHYAANNQETDRFVVSAEVDERTLREIYLAAFEHVVRTQRPATLMCSYNKVNGTWASQHHWLQTEVLRDEWGFDGLVVSDWGAVNDRAAAVAAGVDLTMPGGGSDAPVAEAVRSGALDEAVLDRAVGRLLALIDRTHAAAAAGAGSDPAHDAHHALARQVAHEGAVLLKNDGGLLPFAPGGSETVAVVGEFARTPRYQGAGSSQVTHTRLDSALDALVAALGEDRVRFAPGFTLDDGDGGPDPALVAEAVEAAQAADVVVCFLGLPAARESEGFDRTDILLPAGQLAVLAAVAAVNPAVAVVLSNGGLVSVAEWQDEARAVLEGWLLGQASGAALADLVVGAASPSGRLAETIPLRLEDTPSYLHFPGAEQVVVYGETVYVGYRYYDTLDRPVAYPFGHGLSYTTFAYDDLRASLEPGGGCAVSFTLTNTGSVAGAEVAQVYVRDVEATVDRPVHELAGFAKVHLAPGASERVTVALDERAFAYWSVRDRRWRVEAGEFEIRVGASSRDIRATATVLSPGDGVPVTLTAMSSVGDWLDHPVGGPLLAEAFPVLAGDGSHPPSAFERMVRGMPLVKVAGMGGGRGAGARVRELVAAVADAAGRAGGGGDPR